MARGNFFLGTPCPSGTRKKAIPAAGSYGSSKLGSARKAEMVLNVMGGNLINATWLLSRHFPLWRLQSAPEPSDQEATTWWCGCLPREDENESALWILNDQKKMKTKTRIFCIFYHLFSRGSIILSFRSLKEGFYLSLKVTDYFFDLYWKFELSR